MSSSEQMKRILVIGIGPGGPEHLTVQAIDALNQADVIFVFDKGEEKSDLLQLRRDICERYRGGRPYRLIEIADPQRSASGPYNADVRAWHGARAELVKNLIRDELADDGCGAFLVWGDPAFYDSTLRILETVAGDAAIRRVTTTSVTVARPPRPEPRAGRADLPRTPRGTALAARVARGRHGRAAACRPGGR